MHSAIRRAQSPLVESIGKSLPSTSLGPAYLQGLELATPPSILTQVVTDHLGTTALRNHGFANRAHQRSVATAVSPAIKALTESVSEPFLASLMPVLNGFNHPLSQQLAGIAAPHPGMPSPKDLGLLSGLSSWMVTDETLKRVTGIPASVAEIVASAALSERAFVDSPGCPTSPDP
jgi:hypothetical protein